MVAFIALATCVAGCVPRGDPDDRDGDGVLNGNDVAADDPWRCSDDDQDQCDDCTVHGRVDTANDGFDADGDGRCELPLDTTCMHGGNAARDPSRHDACKLLAFANADRALFTREAEGARPLIWDEGIWEVAVGHSRDMCERSYFAHSNPEGQDATARARAHGNGWFLAENIHRLHDVVLGHHQFMAEPTCVGHRANILNPRAIRAAAGVFACDNARSAFTGWTLLTEDFHVAASLPAAPFCDDAQLACEIPGNPVSVVVAFCAPGQCPAIDAGVLDGWSCPVD